MQNTLDKHLHIICLNVPYPVDYGGVFDLFYKLPALQEQGVKIHLHCFEYGRGEQPALNRFCVSVDYYKRKTGLRSFSLIEPYIVSSRKDDKLSERLLQDDYPILVEGVHCTHLLNDKRFAKRKCFVRLHNVEHVYYRTLSTFTSSVFKQLYYSWESSCLKNFEKKIATKATFFSVTKKDAEAYQQLGANQIKYLPLFLPDWKVSGKEGKGTFCLYQGDLSVGENEKAAEWLVSAVFQSLEVQLKIAGKNPSKQLKHLVSKTKNVTLIANPHENEMQQLIADAHINIIPSFNPTGIKLKLLNALYNGRHCLVNKITIEGTGLDEACVIAESESDFKSAIIKLFTQDFTSADNALRHQLLNTIFNNRQNAKQLMQAIWNET